MSFKKGDRVICWAETDRPKHGIVNALNFPRAGFVGVVWDSMLKQGRKTAFCYHESTLKKEQSHGPETI